MGMFPSQGVSIGDKKLHAGGCLFQVGVPQIGACRDQKSNANVDESCAYTNRFT